MSNNANISVIRICTDLRGFELAHQINQFFGFELQRTEDFGLNSMEKMQFGFDCFSFHNPAYRITLMLIKNMANNGNEMLVSNLKYVDYLFVITGRDHAKVRENFLNSLSKIPVNRGNKSKLSQRVLNFISNIPQIDIIKTQTIYPSDKKTKYISDNHIFNFQTYQEEILKIDE